VTVSTTLKTIEFKNSTEELPPPPTLVPVDLRKTLRNSNGSNISIPTNAVFEVLLRKYNSDGSLSNETYTFRLDRYNSWGNGTHNSDCLKYIPEGQYRISELNSSNYIVSYSVTPASAWLRNNNINISGSTGIQIEVINRQLPPTTWDTTTTWYPPPITTPSTTTTDYTYYTSTTTYYYPPPETSVFGTTRPPAIYGPPDEPTKATPPPTTDEPTIDKPTTPTVPPDTRPSETPGTTTEELIEIPTQPPPLTNMPPEEPVTTKAEPKDNPQTGDNMSILWLLALLASSVFSVFVMYKKKRR
jgi:LPXTG-motif cell wall-anchored protein